MIWNFWSAVYVSRSPDFYHFFITCNNYGKTRSLFPRWLPRLLCSPKACHVFPAISSITNQLLALNHRKAWSAPTIPRLLINQRRKAQPHFQHGTSRNWYRPQNSCTPVLENHSKMVKKTLEFRIIRASSENLSKELR